MESNDLISREAAIAAVEKILEEYKRDPLGCFLTKASGLPAARDAINAIPAHWRSASRNTNIGTIVKAARLGVGKGLRQFAKSIGFAPSRMCEIEAGDDVLDSELLAIATAIEEARQESYRWRDEMAEKLLTADRRWEELRASISWDYNCCFGIETDFVRGKREAYLRCLQEVCRIIDRLAPPADGAEEK